MIPALILALILAAGAGAAAAIGVADVVRARRGQCVPEQPVLLMLLAASFAGLSFGVWPR